MRWEWTYPPDDQSCPFARHAATSALLSARVPRAMFEPVAMVLGELTANAVQHARTPFTVTLDVDPVRLHVEVFDGDTNAPVLLAPGLDATSGRGLSMVAALATEWGWASAVRRGVDGKVVWAMLTLGGAYPVGDGT